MKVIWKSGLLEGDKFLMGYIKILRRLKEIYLIEFEQSNIKQIPDELSQKNLPMSYQFYDPILAFTREKLTK
jgi:hypothetical protein